MIYCIKCEAQCSEVATICPKCGHLLSQDQKSQIEQNIKESHPRFYPFVIQRIFVFSVVNIIICMTLGISVLVSVSSITLFVIILAPVYWLHCKFTILIVTNKRTILKTGMLCRRTSEVRHIDVRNTVITQTLTNRIFGVGKIQILSAGQGGTEIEILGIHDPEHIRRLIDKYL